MDIVWDGSTQAGGLKDEWIAIRQRLANAANTQDWPEVFSLLDEHRELVNTWRLDDQALDAPLHQAAYHGASIDVVKRLTDLGAWRTLQNSRGERPVDVAERRQHYHLLDALTPVYRRRAPIGVLLKIQSHFHDVIRGRVALLVRKHALRLPELEPLLEVEESSIWFAVPGMYGGFSYSLESDGVQARLIAESWCRVEAGSGERHEITSEGFSLVEEGFV